MILKNADVLILYETLGRLMDNKELKFNVKVGYLMAKNKATLESIANLVYDMRREIVLTYGTSDGEEIQIPKESIEELNSKIEELMNVENEVEIIQIPIEMLEKSEMSFEDIVGLTYMIQPFNSSEVVIPKEELDVIDS